MASSVQKNGFQCMVFQFCPTNEVHYYSNKILFLWWLNMTIFYDAFSHYHQANSTVVNIKYLLYSWAGLNFLLKHWIPTGWWNLVQVCNFIKNSLSLVLVSDPLNVVEVFYTWIAKLSSSEWDGTGKKCHGEVLDKNAVKNHFGIFTSSTLTWAHET